MSISNNIVYVHEPDDLQCGQAVLAMVTGLPVEQVAEQLSNFRETKLAEMRKFLHSSGVSMSDKRQEADKAEELPEYALLSLETPRCWHWSLYAKGTFYDPEHGVMTDFPVCARKYYWELKNESEGSE